MLSAQLRAEGPRQTALLFGEVFGVQSIQSFWFSANLYFLLLWLDCFLPTLLMFFDVCRCLRSIIFLTARSNYVGFVFKERPGCQTFLSESPIAVKWAQCVL